MSDVEMTLPDALARAAAAHREGRLAEAEQLYAAIVRTMPDHVDALFNRGAVLLALGRWEDALSTYGRVLAISAKVAEALGNRGFALLQLGRPGEAMSSYAAAIALNPGYVDAVFSRGVTLLSRARPAEALASFGRVLAIAPRHPEALNNRGLALLDLQRPAEALAGFDLALAIAPGYVDALGNRGGARLALGRLDAALASFRAALAVSPDHAGAHGDLGTTLRDAGDLERAIAHHRRRVALRPQDAAARGELGNSQRFGGGIASAIACYRQSLALDPGDAGAFGNLGYAFLARAGAASAFAVARRAFSIRPSREIATLLVKCLEEPVAIPGNLRPLVSRILSQRWARPGSLVAVGLHLTNAAGGEGAPSDSDLRAMAGDALLQQLLVLSPVIGADLERRLTRLRARWLDASSDPAADSAQTGELLGFFCALARQCFLNEYVFAATGEEIAKAERLRRSLVEAMAVGAAIAPSHLVAVAAYFPLHVLPGIERLLERSWPEAVDTVLTQQVREPLAEVTAAASIPRLTPIAAAVSQAVQRQYEESPYPRWVDTLAAGVPVAVDAYLRQVFPRASFRGRTGMDRADVLIAGCGTGQQSIETAMTFKNRSVLAVDLSRASLGYAMRKSRELGAPPIDYAQADIMELEDLGRDFDLIEASGVLHHLADPFAGWRILLSLLRPGGVMRLGFYSELARRDIAAARAFIAERNLGASPGEIRAFRQELLTLGDRSWVRSIVESGDFATLGACRDLLFHVLEHRLSLPQIAAFLDAEALRFIGFEASLATRAAYAGRFPGDLAMNDLRSWHVFETENPDTFRGMYQFWVQKPE